MARANVYLPDDLHERARRADLDVSELTQRRSRPSCSAASADVVTGVGLRDARVNRLLAGCEVVPLSELLARRAATLRHEARRGSVVDASVVATAEVNGGGVVPRSDLDELRALAARSPIVSAVRVP